MPVVNRGRQVEVGVAPLGQVFCGVRTTPGLRFSQGHARALDFLDTNARRAHPARDRKRGRLDMGLEPIALAP
jgi:hypothetical protein